MRILSSIALMAAIMLPQSNAYSQNIFHINCAGTTTTTSLLNPKDNGSEFEKFSISINSYNGYFSTNGKVLLGPTFDPKQPKLILSIGESFYSYKHAYSDDLPNPSNINNKNTIRYETAINLHRYTGQLEIIENIQTTGINNSFTIISGKYSCSKINDRKF